MAETRISEMPEVWRRLKALKKLQFEKLKLDGELEKEIELMIHNKFGDKYKSIFEIRSKIVDGSVEPTDEECDFSLEDTDFDSSIEEEDVKVKGIPGFWLNALQNFVRIRDWISTEDEEVLNHLIDISLVPNEDPSKLKLEFKFAPNEYFTNEVLTKEYEISYGPDPNSLWNVNPFFVVKREGCQIDWKKGKNPMAEMQKEHKSVLDYDELPSFFCFFNPPEESPESKLELNQDLEDYLWDDWQTGLLMVQTVVPNAVLCYTGDISDNDDEEETDSSDWQSSEDTDFETDSETNKFD